MPVFSYTAINISGKKVKGHLDATHIQEAKEKLRSQGVMILKIDLFKERSFFSNKKKLSGTHLVTITSQLSELLSAKIPLYESLSSLEEMYRGEAFHHILGSLTEDIKRGVSLSLAMSKFPSSFSTLYISMIKAGEAIGALDKSLSKLSHFLHKQNQLKKKLTTTLIYPGVLFVFSFFVILTLLIFVIPSLEALFSEREINGFTKLIFGLSHFVTQKWGWYFSCLSLALPIGLIFYKKKKKRILEGILSLPIINKIVKETAIARFCKTLSTLLIGGVSMKEALSISRHVINFSSLEKVIEEAELKIIEGSLLSIELKKSPLIPSLMSRMVAIGEEGGNIAAMLEKVADFYEEEVEKKLSRMMALSGPIILLIMGGFVGLIMMAVLLPLTDASVFIN